MRWCFHGNRGKHHHHCDQTEILTWSCSDVDPTSPEHDLAAPSEKCDRRRSLTFWEISVFAVPADRWDDWRRSHVCGLFMELDLGGEGRGGQLAWLSPTSLKLSYYVHHVHLVCLIRPQTNRRCFMLMRPKCSIHTRISQRNNTTSTTFTLTDYITSASSWESAY